MSFQTDFSLSELAQRRKRLAERLPEGAIALIPGAEKPRGSSLFRQFNDFYYLCGVEEPGCYLSISHTGESVIYMPEDNHGSDLNPGNAEFVTRTTGLDIVRPLSLLTRRLQWNRLVYLPGREGEGEKESWDSLERWRQATLNDPLDGRRSRMGQIASNLRVEFPLLELRDLSPIMDDLRVVKSETEIALMRRAGELTGLGVLAAMRATRPGVFEYELNAEMQYVYLRGGARGASYAPIVPGSANAGDSHYMANNSVLEDGDIVLADCAPDYRYYTSDIGRMWPINGVFSPVQASLYNYVLAYHATLLGMIRPGAIRAEIHSKAAETMRPVFEKWEFASNEQRETAACLFTFHDHISHGVGMCVHDVDLHHHRPLEPGMTFAVDPMAWDRKNQTFYRVEDTVVVTENGCEILTASCPLAINEIEAAMRR
jgi:Xaa-Pro aminopeptidase